MNIGFSIKWDKHSLLSGGNVIGDELVGESLCRSLRGLPGVKKAELYAPNCMPEDPLDFLVYLNDNEPMKDLARKHILYWQNGYGDRAVDRLKVFHDWGYDGYLFFSRRLLELHRKEGHEGIFLPFGVDLELFYPREVDPELEFEVAYVGNDIKGVDRSVKYLYPAGDFDFGLFGNWKLPKKKWHKFWKKERKWEPYQRLFDTISRGKIPQEKVPALYSSAKVNLNCTIQFCVDWDVITLRTFEVLACRGFLITDRVPAAVGTLEECLVFTTGGDDLEKKIHYYLDHPSEREEIARRGYDYVVDHASVEARARELLSYMEGLG